MSTSTPGTDSASPPPAPSAPRPTAPTGEVVRHAETQARFLPLDAYRGLIMILLVSDGFGFAQLPDRGLYHYIAEQFKHRPWGGAVFYDLIMPAFLFMVGVAMPFAFARRGEGEASRRGAARHVLIRCLRLVVISQIMVSIELSRPHLQFHNTLTQVAATYLICYFLMRLRWRQQVAAVVALLAVHSSIYLLFPGPSGAWAEVTNAVARLTAGSWAPIIPGRV